MRSAARRGFTLVELGMSLAVAAVLVVAVGGLVVIMSRTMPQTAAGASPTVSTSAAAEGPTAAAVAVEQLSADVACATVIKTGAASVITFIVPDRTGDNQPETITYSWSGTTGDPLRRVMNGGTPVTVAADVRDFTLGYDLTSAFDRVAGSTAAGSEQLLFAADSAAATTQNVRASNWYAMYVMPPLPPDALDWAITRVQLRLRNAPPNDGSITVEVRRADMQGFPTSTILGSATIAESALSAVASPPFRDIPISGVSGLGRSDGVCVVARYAGGVNAAAVIVATQPSPSGSAFLQTATAGGSWSLDTGTVIPVNIYGTITRPTGAAAKGRRYLDRLRVTLKSGFEATPAVESAVRAENRPLVELP